MKTWKAFDIIFATLSAVVVALVVPLHAQLNQPDPAKVQAELGVPAIYLVPISATAGNSTQTTLTIPAPPPGAYNYVCKLDFNDSQGTTGNAQTNSTITTTNFNSWAWKYSLAAATNTQYEHSFDWGQPATGCAKSTSPATATTFVSPSGGNATQFTFSAMYYQAK
jgi:hypothetical protein